MYDVKKENNIILCTAGSTVSDFDSKEFLLLLDRLLDAKKPFTLLIDTSACSHIPFKLGLSIARWMKKRKPDIPGILLGSSVVIRSKLVSEFVSKLFTIQKPVSPNLITTDLEKAKKFLNDIKIPEQ